ncbi:MAG: LysR family transcriptional regulator [Geminicoccaceae bacterium]|nr:LysR family transcriptional regulator [Geminicoccaceae bacterium]
MAPARHLPPLSWLLAFEAAARAEGFSRAARALGTSQPAVSQKVALLEAALGQPLFRRLPRGIALTDAGQRLLSALGEGLDRIEGEVRTLRAGGGAGRLTVVTDFGFAAFWLLPRLGAFRAATGLDVRVLTTQAEIDPRAEPVDLAVAFGEGRWPGCAAEPLFPEVVLPVCAPELLVRHPSATEATDLRPWPLLHLEGDSTHRWLDWDGWFRAAGAEPPPQGRGLALDNYILVVQAALAGEGLALGWRPLVDDLLKAGRLVPALDRPVRTACGYHLVRRRGQEESVPARRFLAWLQGR